MKNTLSILGIDPGSQFVGTAVVSAKPMTLVLNVKTWTLNVPPADLPRRLYRVWHILEHLFKVHQFGIVSVENPLVMRNAIAIDRLARCVGVIQAWAASHDLAIVEYRSTEHRKLSTGHGSIAKIKDEADDAFDNRVKRLRFDQLKEQFDSFGIKFKDVDIHQLDAMSLAIAAKVEYEAGQHDNP